MNCERALDWMQRELDDDLNDEEKQQLQQHLTHCPSCRDQYDRLQAISAELETLPKITPPISIVDSILPQLHKEEVAKSGAVGGQSIRSRETDRVSVFHKVWKNKRLWVYSTVTAASILLIFTVVQSLGGLNEMAIDTGEHGSVGITSDIQGNESEYKANEEADTGFESSADSEPLSGAIPDEAGEMEGYDSSPFVSDEQERGDHDQSNMGEKLYYMSPDGTYTAHEGVEDIRIDKDGQPHYLSKAHLEHPWEVEHMEWVSSEQLYFVLFNPSDQEWEYWLIHVDQFTEEQLEGPYHSRDE